MNSIQFSKNIVNELTINFPKIKCSYEFDEYTDTHYIEIIPKSEFDYNEHLNTFIDDVYFNFIERFSSESIAFITNNGESKLTKVCYEISGKDFKELSLIYWNLKDIQPFVNIPARTNDEFYLEEEYSLAA